MRKTYLLFDCDYLCHRAHHSTGQLAYGGKLTGVLFGFFKAIISIQDRFTTDHCVFCFDGPGPRVRSDLLPSYKMNRQPGATSFFQEGRKAIRTQAEALRMHYLPEIGYRNIFWEEGYEADDMIASVLISNKKKFDAIIVSADQDMYQLLAPKVSMYNPRTHELITEQKFKSVYKLEPSDWVKVKALAGCKSDNIPGTYGVGEQTAVKYFNRSLESSYAYEKAREGVRAEQYTKNLSLVKLPYENTPECKLVKDRLNNRKFNRLMDRLGIRTLRLGA